MDTAPSDLTAGPLWRLRVALTDRPGALARLTASLAARDCNILALTVLRMPDGVVDDLIISTPDELRPADLVTLIRGIGGRCAGITRADPHDLTDGPTTALRAATALAAESMSYPEAVRALLGADSVEPAEPDDASTDHQPVVDGTLRVRRGWSPFTEVELARAAALADLVHTLDLPASGPIAVLTSDGAGLVLRPGLPTDADAVAAMHDRCSPATLFARYHTGTRAVPRRLLHRLLAPPRGQTVVGVLGHQVVALGQLINTNDPSVGEVSLLVEDDWHGRGVGTALLAHVVRLARAAGYAELVGWCLPGERGLIRTAARAGLHATTSYEDKLLRVSLSVSRDTHSAVADHLPANEGGSQPENPSEDHAELPEQRTDAVRVGSLGPRAIRALRPNP
ncbi:MAG TPA: GNAT family N-acetyltransferase [Pseudonocardiaceae bacterium]|jgi:GNAT superfamily N-acetyltransferase|nr:GNAT family N-acetyltransferase [Pseudonocardiaceae bacterium]